MDRTLHIAAGLFWLAIVAPVGSAQVTPARQSAIFPKQPATGYVTDCRVIRVIDGDTVVVEMKQQLNIRLLQCWAPESRTKDSAEKVKGIAAKQHMQQLIDEEDQVRLFVPLTNDLTEAITLGRALGYLWRKGDEVSLNQMQVNDGFATTTKSQ